MKKDNKLFIDLLGGKITENQNNNTYSIMVKFDNDQPTVLATNININDDFKLVFKAPSDSAQNSSFIEFTDTITGKKIKIYAYKND